MVEFDKKIFCHHLGTPLFLPERPRESLLRGVNKIKSLGVPGQRYNGYGITCSLFDNVE